MPLVRHRVERRELFNIVFDKRTKWRVPRNSHRPAIIDASVQANVLTNRFTELASPPCYRKHFLNMFS